MNFASIKDALIKAAKGGSSNYMGAVTLNSVLGVAHNATMSTVASASGNFVLQTLESNHQANYFGHSPTFRSSVTNALDSLGLLRHRSDKFSMFANHFLVASTENSIATVLGCLLFGVAGGGVGQSVTDAVVGTIPYAMLGMLSQLLSVSNPNNTPLPTHRCS